MFNITTVLLDTFMVCTFGFKDLFKSSSAFLNCERREYATCKFMRKCQLINLLIVQDPHLKQLGLITDGLGQMLRRRSIYLRPALGIEPRLTNRR